MPGNDRKIKILFIVTSCRKSGPTQQLYNIIRNLDFTTFNAMMITLYKEDEEQSQINFFGELLKVKKVPTTKIQILTGFDFMLKKIIRKYEPDIIHSHGVFPDFAVSKIMPQRQIHTIRNYMWEDYIDKYGKIVGNFFVYLSLYTIKKAKLSLVCSSSLSNLYKKNKSIDIEYIRNGVNTEKYKIVNQDEKKQLRNSLDMPKNAFIFVYTGSFLPRKNIPFLCEVFENEFKDDKNTILLLLGDGVEKSMLEKRYASMKNMIFLGNKRNVDNYLNASDFFISSSKSEGLPNSVLEAISSGLPVILSDIPQHLEILEEGKKLGEIGYSFKLNDKEDLAKIMKSVIKSKVIDSEICRRVACELFDSKTVSREYQSRYLEIWKQEHAKK